MRTDVVIVGAGPTGLSLACQLARYGVDHVVVDKNNGVTPYSKALGVHARTLEIYDQIGLADMAVSQGSIAAKARMIVGGEVRGEMDFSKIGESMSPFPFVLMLEQSKNEKLLYEHLQESGSGVRWTTELTDLRQDEDGVTAVVKNANGDTEEIEARFLVGCDGAKSFVRHKLGLGFEGSTFERMFYVADAQIDWQFSHDALHVCLAQSSFAVFFPLKGEKRYRIVGVFPEEFAKDEGDVLYEEIEERVKSEVQLDLDIHDVEWFSTYKVHARHVSSFSAGRCFLAGDSAHIHSPAGAQGMNTGIQDAYNLAWKLAFVLRGDGRFELLETYNEERLENAKNLLQTTDRMFQLAAGTEWILAFLRTNVFPAAAKYIFGIDAVRRFIFPILSQIGINYRHSSASMHEGDENFSVKAGDRMPYFVIDGENFYDRLRDSKFHLVSFTDGRSAASEITEEVGSKYSKMLDLNIVPLFPDLTGIFGTKKAFNVLLRPDNYVAFITSDTTFRPVEKYLGRYL